MTADELDGINEGDRWCGINDKVELDVMEVLFDGAFE